MIEGSCVLWQAPTTLRLTIKAINPPHLFPAIDILGGKAVRLWQGDYGRKVDIGDRTPAEAARKWEQDGAQWLHVVDLDGAKTGNSINLNCVEELTRAVNLPVQFGGGIRTADAARAAFDAGVDRIVLGSAAVRSRGFVEEMIEEYGERIVVSIDTRNGVVAIDGWTDQTQISAIDLLADMQRLGISTVIYTPILVDASEEGPELEELKIVAQATSVNLIYASGIGSIEHVRSLAKLGLRNLTGVIVGTALYKERFSIREADAVLREASQALSHA